MDKLNIEELENTIVSDYSDKARELDTKPMTEQQLLRMYADYTLPLYEYLDRLFDFPYAICNEIRAMLGHLSQYNSDKQSNRIELEKAYGHFRRVNLDSLKVICDELDRSLSYNWIKDTKYDFRDYQNNYIKEFGERLICARNRYLEAQKSESVGSDSGIHNVFNLYYESAVMYIKLKQYYLKHICDKDYKKIKKGTVIKRFLTIILTLYGIIVTVIGFC